MSIKSWGHLQVPWSRLRQLGQIERLTPSQQHMSYSRPPCSPGAPAAPAIASATQRKTPGFIVSNAVGLAPVLPGQVAGVTVSRVSRSQTICPPHRENPYTHRIEGIRRGFCFPC